jgi:hypothetical protein
VKRYLIPFGVGIMLGMGSVPMLMGAAVPAATRTPASLTALPAAPPILHV